MKYPKIGAWSLGGCAALAISASASAQDAPQGGGLTEIVVTAQKREQNVQETPLAITAIGGDTLVAQGVTEVRELSRIDPTLQIGQATGVVTTFIRGVGNPVTTAGNEASVPVYIDDVYFVRASAPFFDLSSVERVEVLKGPQGTLFGRNASGGVISIYTRDPKLDKMEFEGRLGYANFDTVDAKGYLSIPFGSRVAANLAVSYHKQHDGWGKNKQLVDPFDTSKGFAPGGDDYWRNRSFSARGKILAELTNTTTLKLIGYYQKSRSEIGFYARPFPGTIGGTPDGPHNGFANVCGLHPCPSQVMPKLGFYDVSLPTHRYPGSRTDTGPQYDTSEGYGFSGRLDQEMGFADFVSITAYRKNKETFFANGNYSPYAWAFYDLNIVDRQFSQEFQLKSKPFSPVTWIVGAYYLNADGGFNPTRIAGPAVSVPAGGGLAAIDLYGQQKVKSYAGFAQVTVPLGERTNVTGGLRYTKDQVIGRGSQQITFTADQAAFLFDFFQTPGGGGLTADQANATLAAIQARTPTTPSGGPEKENFKKVTWKGSIDHKFNDDVMVYASISRGYKAGTFNTLPLDSAALRPEVVDAYEIGLKSELFDRKVRVNLALFWNDIDSPQVQAQRNGLVFLKNAGSARTKGAEIDVTVAAAEGLTLRFAGSYLDAKFREFPDAPAYCPSPVVSPAECALLAPAPPLAPGNLNTIQIDAKGNRLPYASKWKFNAAVNYETELASAGKLSFDLNANYASNFNWDADNVIKEPAHFLLDGSVAFSPAAFDNLTVRFWMKNITDRKYNVNYYAQASGSAYSSAPGAPRTFGGELIVRF